MVTAERGGGWGGWGVAPSSPLRLSDALLLLLLSLLATVAGGDGEEHPQCGEYSNQVLEDGMCRLVATLPQMDEGEGRCPDMFRCTDEVAFWLRENEGRKQQILALKETISELQEELRNHRHRVKVLELQSEERNRVNSSLEQRVHELEDHYAEASTLLHLQGSLLYSLQAQIGNLSLQVEKVRRNPGCMINIVKTSPLLSAQEALHPEVQHVRNCPIDCASIYYNGVYIRVCVCVCVSPQRCSM
ncbi:uncharacterized protein LOC116223710 [Clupea harengus]|uniref:Uncharacterized protein LOC116223710 n=1 Tax=Clupea harengus TaxID=7950 RepID=A0A6P8GIB9_CLUHA|nr:uncharacterized protein LOC116223710 [Clupea harengus]